MCIRDSFNEGYATGFLQKSKIPILNLAIRHFRYLNDNYRTEQNRAVKERDARCLKESYGNSEIYQTFSDGIYDQGYARIIHIPICRSESKHYINEEFLIQKFDSDCYNSFKSENKPFISLKANIPITLNQVDKLCLDTIETIKNGGASAVVGDEEIKCEEIIKENIENLLSFGQSL